jgi:hypothetical protein
MISVWKNPFLYPGALRSWRRYLANSFTMPMSLGAAIFFSPEVLSEKALYYVLYFLDECIEKSLGV